MYTILCIHIYVAFTLLAREETRFDSFEKSKTMKVASAKGQGPEHHGPSGGSPLGPSPNPTGPDRTGLGTVDGKAR